MVLSHIYLVSSLEDGVVGIRVLLPRGGHCGDTLFITEYKSPLYVDAG